MFGVYRFQLSVLVLLYRLVSPQFLDYFRKENPVDGLLRRLRHTIMGIHVVLNDAEEMQFTNSMVKQWINEFKYVIYNIENLTDEIVYASLVIKHIRRRKNSRKNFKLGFDDMIMKVKDFVKHKDIF